MSNLSYQYLARATGPTVDLKEEFGVLVSGYFNERFDLPVEDPLYDTKVTSLSDLLDAQNVMAVKYHTTYNHVLENAVQSELSVLSSGLDAVSGLPETVSGLQQSVSGLQDSVSGLQGDIVRIDGILENLDVEELTLLVSGLSEKAETLETLVEDLQDIVTTGPSGIQYAGIIDLSNTDIFPTGAVGPVDLSVYFSDLNIAGPFAFDVVGSYEPVDIEYAGVSGLSIKDGDTLYVNSAQASGLSIVPVRTKVDLLSQRVDTTLLNMDQAFQILTDKMKVMETYIKYTESTITALVQTGENQAVPMNFTQVLDTYTWPSGPAGVIVPAYDNNGPYTASGIDLLGVPVNFKTLGNPFASPFDGIYDHTGIFNIETEDQTYLINQFYSSDVTVTFTTTSGLRATKLIVTGIDCPVQFEYDALEQEPAPTTIVSANSLTWNYDAANQPLDVVVTFKFYQPMSAFLVNLQAAIYFYTSVTNTEFSQTGTENEIVYYYAYFSNENAPLRTFQVDDKITINGTNVVGSGDVPFTSLEATIVEGNISSTFYTAAATEYPITLYGIIGPNSAETGTEVRFISAEDLGTTYTPFNNIKLLGSLPGSGDLFMLPNIDVVADTALPPVPDFFTEGVLDQNIVIDGNSVSIDLAYPLPGNYTMINGSTTVKVTGTKSNTVTPAPTAFTVSAALVTAHTITAGSNKINITFTLTALDGDDFYTDAQMSVTLNGLNTFVATLPTGTAIDFAEAIKAKVITSSTSLQRIRLTVPDTIGGEPTSGVVVSNLSYSEA